jgi:hypothetical protein
MFDHACLRRRKLVDHGICVNEGKNIKGLSCKECTTKNRCDQYESIQPYIPSVDPFYSLDTEVAEPIAFALSDEGKDNLLIVGPPGCLSGDTIVRFRRGKRNSGRNYTLREAYYKFNRIQKTDSSKKNTNIKWDKNQKTEIQSLHRDGSVNYHEIARIVYSGRKPTYVVETESGKKIRATKDHPFKTRNGWLQLEDLNVGDTVMCRNDLPVSNGGRKKMTHRRKVVTCKYHPNGRVKITEKYRYKEIYRSLIVVEALMNDMEVDEYIKILKTDKDKSKKLQFLPTGLVIHHKDENPQNDEISNLAIMTKVEHDKLHGKTNKKNFNNQTAIEEIIVSIQFFGDEDVYDISMVSEPRNFVANGFIVHNCGKSSLVMMIAAITDWQLIRFSCSEETRLHAVVGQWLVEGDKMVWSDGYATDALRHGKILLEDEADFMRPELRGALHPLLERDGEITLQQYHPTNKKSFLEVVKRHPDFRWVSTANTIGLGDDDFMYHGVQFMNVAARDRYSVIVEMDYMDPEDESVVLQKKCGVDEDTGMMMAKAAHALRELWKQKEIEFVFGMRRLLAWAKYHHFYVDHGLSHKAIKLSILSFAAPKDKNKIMEIIKVHCPHEWVRPLE